MKLIIQIPCYNEEETLPQTFTELPKSIEGIDKIECQVVNDGSTDNTLEVAKQLGVDHIVSFKKNRGLAAAFRAGVENAIAQGADILVNTDADNQYQGSDVPKLVNPILHGVADIVVGCRPIDKNPDFSFLKKKFQKLGSWVLRAISKTDARDAASGFRAFSRNALLHMNIFSEFSYCMETLIQAGLGNMKIVSVDVGVNPKTRDSRLFKNVFQYVWRSAKTIISIFILYRSNVLFGIIAISCFLLSLILAIRFLLLVTFGDAAGEDFWPSIILAGVLLVISIQVYLTGVIASLVSSNRKISEEIVYRLRKMDATAENQVRTESEVPE
jgi:glycosyltransferase involved in cell wall biosynthesis